MQIQPLLHVYTGNGKGKTTAAMGLAVRAVGHGHKVLIAQFMKDGQSGELTALRMLPGITIHDSKPMNHFTYQMTEEELQEERVRQTAELATIAAEIKTLQPQLIILDELAVAMQYNLVPQDAAMELVETALASGETVVTGRGAPERLMDRADYVSRIDAVKHPFDEGIPARKGVEW